MIWRALPLGCAALLLGASGTYMVLAARSERARDEAAGMSGGDPARGADSIAVRGCGGCHAIEGIPGARGTVGPALDRLAFRGILPGGAPNTTRNLLFWIRFPQQVSPGTALPDLDIPENEARDIAAYLYSPR